MKAYKLLELSTDGKLYPLFINNKVETPMNVWVSGENHPTKGFSKRPGWHVGEICSAPWLMSKDGTYKARRVGWKRVWCEVEYNDHHNYSEEVLGLPGKCMKNKIPENGYYLFREKGRCTWIITSDIKVTRILDEDERQKILKEMDYDEVEGFEPYKKAFEKRFKTIEEKKKK